MFRRKRVLKIVIAIMAVLVAIFFAHRAWRDRPREGGIVAYRSDSRHAWGYTHCGCSHTGYFIITDEFLHWYITGHDSLAVRGEIVSRDGNEITFRTVGAMEQREGKLTIQDGRLHVIEGDRYYSLRKTHLGRDVKEAVDNFDYAAWRAEVFPDETERDDS